MAFLTNHVVTNRVVTNRVTGSVRRLTHEWRTRCAESPQERANRYVSHMPTAVLG